MSERTTIGGVNYETVGSSTSNLLLKCNGTARILWGNKLIDLIKNGKLVSDNSSDSIFIISDESEIKNDGIYVLVKDNTNYLILNKKGKKYNLTETDLYISTSNKLEITIEQKQQALENIGIYYNTMEDLQKANLKLGIVYVLEDKNLYIINDGVISEFEAKLQTVTVEQEQKLGEVINGSTKIVLSIAGENYLILENKNISIKLTLVIDDNFELQSAGADSNTGYRLYINDTGSCLDVDNINVRNGIAKYIEITTKSLKDLIQNNSLNPHEWYLITDYKNPWKVLENSFRLILVQALTNNSLYEEGKLFQNQNVSIHFDLNAEWYYSTEDGLEMKLLQGRITWMRDERGNEANFDFLDFPENDINGTAIILYNYDNNLKSIFSSNSYNNKITMDENDFLSTKIRNVNKFSATLLNCNFLKLSNCWFQVGVIKNVNCFSDLEGVEFGLQTHRLLYNAKKEKIIYIKNDQVIITSTNEIHRGMIVMHSGIEEIPDGWAICDGNEYTYNGITSKTPNLVNRFIKAVGDIANIAEVNNSDLTLTNDLTIKTDHLPEHSHTFNGTTSSSDLSVISNLSISTDSPTAVHDSDGPVDVVTSVTYEPNNSTHSHTITGITSEDGSQWTNKSIKIEPNYYALIFIMKL